VKQDGGCRMCRTPLEHAWHAFTPSEKVPALQASHTPVEPSLTWLMLQAPSHRVACSSAPVHGWQVVWPARELNVLTEHGVHWEFVPLQEDNTNRTQSVNKPQPPRIARPV
jgi:hypothetical protein